MPKDKQKHPGGRPPVRGATASEDLNIRLMPGEKARWKAEAERRGMTLSEFVRDVVNREAKA